MQTFFAIESLIDQIAAELGVDPFEVRLRNAAAPGDTDLDGHPFARPRSRDVLVDVARSDGLGAAGCTGARSRHRADRARHIAGGKTSLIVAAHPDGRIESRPAPTNPEPARFTVIQRVLAAELGVDPSTISVARGDTTSAPLDPGSGGSKGTVLLGHAALDAAQKLRAALAERPRGPVRVVGETTQVAKPGDPVWLNYCAYGVELSVDRGDRGDRDPRRGDGCRRRHDHQSRSRTGVRSKAAFTMGLGHALTEELYLEEGRILNPTLAEYKLPCQRDMPPLRIIELSPDGGPGPYGAKAGGEFNIAAWRPAIGNAIAAACGVRLEVMSFTSERVYAALQR